LDDGTLRLVEALIFAAPEPVETERLVEIVGNITIDDVKTGIDRLNSDYEREERAFRIIRGAGGFRFATMPQFGRWVRRMVVGSGRIKLSRAALETLSLIAYRQPTSRAEIEAVRGVDVSGVLRLLLERKLIRIKGRDSAPGRPLLYVTTPNFLRHFGIDSLADLPRPEEMGELEGSSFGTTRKGDTDELFSEDDTIGGDSDID